MLTIHDDYSVVESKSYRSDSNEKEYLGEQETLIERNTEHVLITLMEEGRAIDIQEFISVEGSMKK